MEFYVSGDKPECVQMLPGYTHSIVNLSDTQPLVTLMWANEMFDAEHPDTFGEKGLILSHTAEVIYMKTDYSDIKFKNNGKLKLLIIVARVPK